MDVGNDIQKRQVDPYKQEYMNTVNITKGELEIKKTEEHSWEEKDRFQWDKLSK